MKHQLPQRVLDTTFEIWSTFDGVDWVFSTATRSNSPAEAIAHTMARQGKHIVIVGRQSLVMSTHFGTRTAKKKRKQLLQPRQAPARVSAPR